MPEKLNQSREGFSEGRAMVYLTLRLLAKESRHLVMCDEHKCHQLASSTLTTTTTDDDEYDHQYNYGK